MELRTLMHGCSQHIQKNKNNNNNNNFYEIKDVNLGLWVVGFLSVSLAKFFRFFDL